MLVVDKMLFSKIKNINSILIQVFKGEFIIFQRFINKTILLIFDLNLLILSDCQKIIYEMSINNLCNKEKEKNTLKKI